MGVHATAALLEQMDQGTFELLAIAVARQLHPVALRNVSQVGVNSEGKSITGAWDAIAIDPGPPTTYHAVFHTTTLRNKLQDKWLGTDPKTLGDVIGVAADFEEIKKAEPDARMEIYLTSNRVLTQDLVQDVTKFCTKRRIIAHFIGQPAITAQLDLTAEGQYHRKHFLGVDQERLDAALLHKICGQSREEHAQRFSLSPLQFADRPQRVEILEAIGQSTARAVILIGASGLGKSATLNAAMSEYIAEGAFAIWIPQENVEAEPFLVAALTRTLKQIMPKLDDEAGSEALRIAQATGKTLLIGIDDINVGSSPNVLLDKICAWSVPNDGQNKIAAGFVTVVPVWPTHWQTYSDLRNRSNDMQAVFIGTLSREEGIAAVSLRTANAVDRENCAEIAENCGYDPLLISLLSPDCDALPEARSGNVVSRYIASVADRLEGKGAFLRGDYTATLHTVAEYIVKARTLNPNIADLRDHLKSHDLSMAALKDLLKDRSIIYADKVNDTLVFRHDRIRDALLIEVFRGAIKSGDSEIFDPYWSQQVGGAIATSEITETVVQNFSLKNPVALAYAYLLSDSQVVFNALREAIIARRPELPQSAYREIAFVGARGDKADFLDLTKGVNADDYYLGRFAQGDPIAAVHFTAAYLRDWQPVSKATDWVARAERHPEFRKRILGLLESDDTHAAAKAELLRLASVLYMPLPIEIVFQTYLRLTDPHRRHARPGVVSCLLRDHNSQREILMIVEELLKFSDHVETAPNFVDNPRFEIVDELSRFTREISTENQEELFRLAAIDKERRQLVRGLLDRNRGISAIRLWLKVVGELETDHQSFALTLYSQHTDTNFSGEPLSFEVRKSLRELWLDRKAHTFERRAALEIWKNVAAVDDLDALHGLASENFEGSNDLQDAALRLCLRLGDLQVVSELQKKLAGKSAAFWLHLAPFVWCEKVEYSIHEYLAGQLSSNGQLSGNALYLFGTMLRILPTPVAQRLLQSYGSGLDIPTLVAASLYCGNESMIAEAHRIIDESDDQKTLLSHVWSYYGYKTLGVSHRLRLEQVHRLETHLSAFPEFSLSMIAEYATENGDIAWRRMFVDPLLSAKTLHHFEPIAELDTRELNEASISHNFPFFWIERFPERGFSYGDAIEIIRKWSEEKPLSDGSLLYVTSVLNYGNRSDLSKLKESISWLELSASLQAQVEYEVCRRSLHWRD